MGRFLEDFERGATFTTPGRTIVDSDVTLFGGLTGDLSELHTNDEYASTTQFGRRIAHGALVFSIAIGLATRTQLVDGTIIALTRIDHLRFTSPVFIGDTITVSKTVIDTAPVGPTQGIVAFDTRVRNQRGRVVAAFVDRLLVARRSDVTTTTESTDQPVPGTQHDRRLTESLG